MQKIFSRYLTKLILFTLITGIIPIISLGFFSYVEASRTVQEKASEGNVLILQHTQMRVEQNLKIIDNAVTYFFNTTLVKDAMEQKLSSHTFEVVNELKREMNRMQPAMLGINDIYLINLKYDWFICKGGLLSLDELPSEFKILTGSGGNKTSYWTRGTISDSNGDSGTASISHSVYLVKNYALNSLQPSGLIIVDVSEYELNKMASNTSKLGDVMILDSECHMLTHPDDSIYGNDISSERYIQELRQNNEASGYFISGTGKEKVQLTFRKSLYNGWIYLSVMAIDEISKDSKIIELMTLFICIGALLITIGISFLGSQKMYFPVRKLQETVRSAFGPVETQQARGDEFQYIRERIHTFIKDKARIDDVIENQMEQLKEILILKLFQGNMKQEEAKEKLLLYGFNTSWRWVCVLALQIDSFEGTVYEEKDRDLMMFAVNNIVSEMMQGEQSLKPMLVNHYQVTLLGGNHESGDAFKSHVYSIAEMIQTKVKQYLDLKVSLGISRIYKDITDASKAYREAREALKYRVMLGDEALLRIEDVQPDNTSDHAFPKEIEKELIDMIKTTDLIKSKELLHRCILAILKGELSHQEYQVSIVSIFTDIMRVVRDAGGSLKELYRQEESIFDQMFNLRTSEEVEQWFSAFILEPAIHLLEVNRGIQYNKISEQIATIIHSEYDSDLSLESCSARINYHPNYVSKVFRNEMGMGFSDYLSKYRIDIAKNWLIETEMRISEIAKRLKYNNSQNFIRCFRKLEGITPGQFREINPNDIKTVLHKEGIL